MNRLCPIFLIAAAILAPDAALARPAAIPGRTAESSINIPPYLVYPIPRHLELRSERFEIDDSVRLVLPEGEGERGEAARLAGRYLARELAERLGVSLSVQIGGDLRPNNRYIVVASFGDSRMVRRLLVRRDLRLTGTDPGPEGYVVDVRKGLVIVGGCDHRGTLYGVQTLLALLPTGSANAWFQGALVRDYPYKPIRGVHLYLPARENIPFFKRFVRDFLVRYKFNTLFVEVGAGMELHSHPELNLGWERLCRWVYAHGGRPVGPDNRFQDSVHPELAGGSYLSRAEVRDLVQWTRQFGIEVIPEIQSLTHAYYLLTAHRELSELPQAEWPDAYCPSNPASYDLLFDVMSEYIDVMEPRTVHIGHDEWRAGGLCDRCRGRTGELFAGDVLKIYRFLKMRGIQTAMWGDHFVTVHNAPGQSSRDGDGLWYDFPPTLESGRMVSRAAPDILMLNWSHDNGAAADSELAAYGFRQIYGNFSGLEFENWRQRSAQPSVLGAEVSTWSAADEFSFGARGLLARMLSSSNYLWSIYDPPKEELIRQTALLMHRARAELSAVRIPASQPQPAFRSVDLTGFFNAAAPDFDPDSGFLLIAGGEYNQPGLWFRLFPATGRRNFAVMLGRPGEPLARYPGSAGPVPVNLKAAGLTFVHGLTGSVSSRGRSEARDPESAFEAVGYYRITYQDGLSVDCPIRAGENIDFAPPGRIVPTYFARPAPVGAADSNFCLFAYEWINPRPDEPIRDFRFITLPGPSLVRPVLLAVTAVGLPAWNIGFN